MRLEARAIFPFFKATLIPRFTRRSGLCPHSQAVFRGRRRAIEHLQFLARLDHLVHQAVVLRLRRRHVIIAVGIHLHLLLRLTRVLRDNPDQALLQLEHVIDLAFHVAGRALRAARYLVNHDVRIRQRETFAFRSRAKQNRRHARRHSETISRHVTSEKLHRVVNRESRRHRATRRVDVNIDVLLRVFHLQEEQLRDDQICDVIIDRRADKNDPVLEQPRIDIVAPLAASQSAPPPSERGRTATNFRWIDS